MALFSRNKKPARLNDVSRSGGEKVVAAKPADAVSGPSIVRDLAHVLKHARVTEKATMHSADGVYTFDVAVDATKRDIMQAVHLLYKVTPRKVRVVTVRAKTVRSRRTGQMGVKGGGKKAYIYLKKGETITIA